MLTIQGVDRDANRLAVRVLGFLSLCAVAAGCGGPATQPSSVYVTSISPRTGNTLGPTRVTILGGGFKPGATVQFGGVTAVTSAVSPNTLTADAPPHAAGAVTVIVTNPDTHYGALPGGFIYEDELVFMLSGMVYETTPNGRVPLDGVVLYCDGCGSPDGHTFVTTDANGLYTFEWTRNGKNWIQFMSKEGYRYAGPIEQLGIPVNVDGNTKFDIELVRR